MARPNQSERRYAVYFKQSDFFTGMAHGFIKDIMANAEKIACAEGDLIFREGDETHYFTS
jgi:hypothetical protein